jgi:pimeloyl-ACP methyl ester carboxylesterase
MPMAFDVDAGGPADGEPVLLLHGFPQDRREWDLVRPALHAAGLRTVAPDQRGYSPGARPAEVAAYRPARLAADAVEIMEAHGAHTFHLVGHDWGAVVAWQVAATYADRVRTLTALSVPHVGAIAQALRDDPRQREMFRYQAMLAAPGSEQAMLADDLNWMRRAMAPLGGRAAPYLEAMRDPGRLTGAVNWYRAHPGFEVWGAELPPVAAPTTFVWGDRDGAVSPTAARLCAGWVTGDYRFVALEDRGHWLPEEAPQETADAIIAATGTGTVC